MAILDSSGSIEEISSKSSDFICSRSGDVKVYQPIKDQGGVILDFQSLKKKAILHHDHRRNICVKLGDWACSSSE